MATEQAILGGGCFWCLDAAFRDLKGVQEVVCGYAGGSVPDPSYPQVCSGTTGHAEVVRVSFDPDRVDYATLLRVFFSLHDPTSLNRQGADLGTQYRSVIYYHSDAQREIAERLIEALSREALWPGPIVTELGPAAYFYPAEADHQDYFRNHPDQGYCRVVIAPKLAKLRVLHPTLVTDEAQGAL